MQFTTKRNIGYISSVKDNNHTVKQSLGKKQHFRGKVKARQNLRGQTVYIQGAIHK